MSSALSNRQSSIDWATLGLSDVTTMIPEHTLSVQYKDSKTGAICNLPARLTREVSQSTPSIDLESFIAATHFGARPSPYYSLLVLDPDAPSHKLCFLRCFLHFCKVNMTNSFNSGTTVAEYAPATPPPFSGTHRYLYLLFSHSSPLSVPLSSSFTHTHQGGRGDAAAEVSTVRVLVVVSTTRPQADRRQLLPRSPSHPEADGQRRRGQRRAVQRLRAQHRARGRRRHSELGQKRVLPTKHRNHSQDELEEQRPDSLNLNTQLSTTRKQKKRLFDAHCHADMTVKNK